MMISAPVTMRCQNGLRFSRFAPLLNVVRMKEPIRGPGTVPTPPKRLVPPMTDEAIACNSHPSAWATSARRHCGDFPGIRYAARLVYVGTDFSMG